MAQTIMPSLPVPAKPHTPIVQEFIDHYNDLVNIIFRKFFDAAFKITLLLVEAKPELFPILEKYKIKTIDNFFSFMDSYVNWIPEETTTGTNIYNHICTLHYILNLPSILNPRVGQDPIDPTTKSPYRWLTKWMIDYAKAMGNWMDTPNSITGPAIESFKTAKKYHMEDYPVPEGGWKTFNEFFARNIDPAKRPIVIDTEDSIIITNPADCAFDGQWDVDENAEVCFKSAEECLQIKNVPWTISQLLAGSDHSRKFAGGTFMHSFLSPADYHRQHAPVSGKIIEAKVIPGICYLEVVLNLDAAPKGDLGGLEMHRSLSAVDREAHIASLKAILGPALDDILAELPSLDTFESLKAELEAPNNAGYQFLQARGLIIIDNPDIGLVAVLPVGMAQVSSVVLSVKAGDIVKKGDEISYFQMGGSDIVMVFQKDGGVTIDKEMKLKEHRNFGMMVAKAPRKKRD